MTTATIAGYALGDRLGAGGFGTVYRARKGEGEERAIKILNSELIGVGMAGKRFEREAETLRAIEHPSCVKVFESGRSAQGNPYFVMEFLQGRDLLHHIRDFGRLGYEEVLRILKPVSEALSVAHERGVVHRDIKASNVFLCEEGRVVLLDFGIAKLLESPGMTLTLTNQVVGTACAMSPEQLAGGQVSARTDVYGLGSLAFHMLTGRAPFDSDSLTLTQYLHGHAARVAPSMHSPVSPEIDRVVMQAMALDAGNRHASCGDFVDGLSQAIQGKSEESSRSVDGIVLHGRFGDCGDDVKCAHESIAAMEDCMTLLREAKFLEVSAGLRSFCFARVLGEWGKPNRNAGESDKVIDKVREAIAERGPAGSTLDVREGVLEMSGERIRGGEILEPSL